MPITTAADRVAKLNSKPATMPADKVPAVPEVEMSLYRAASGNYRNQYRGRIDKAGTVRVRVHIGGSADEHKGEILAGTAEDITFAELQGEKDELAYFEYRDSLQKGVLVRVWVPAKAQHDGIKVIL